MSTHSFPGYPIEVVDDNERGTNQKIYLSPQREPRGGFPGYPIEVNDSTLGTRHPDGSYSHPVRSSQVVQLEPLKSHESTHPVYRSQVVNLDDILSKH